MNDERKMVLASEVVSGDYLHSPNGPVFVIAKETIDSTGVELTDISVEGSSTFQVVPFNVIEENNNTTDLISINTYSIDADDYQENRHNKNWAKIQL